MCSRAWRPKLPEPDLGGPTTPSPRELNLHPPSEVAADAGQEAVY